MASAVISMLTLTHILFLTMVDGKTTEVRLIEQFEVEYERCLVVKQKATETKNVLECLEKKVRQISECGAEKFFGLIAYISLVVKAEA
jgi:hypothetical protein